MIPAYGDAVGAYNDYVTGAAILVKSTSADISLNDVEIQSSTGVALLTALNSDSMSRYLKQDVGSGVNVTVTDSTIDGDFIHDDYQRDMVVTLDGSTLNGDINHSTAEEWNEKWSEYADDEKSTLGESGRWYFYHPNSRDHADADQRRGVEFAIRIHQVLYFNDRLSSHVADVW